MRNSEKFLLNKRKFLNSKFEFPIISINRKKMKLKKQYLLTI